MCHIFSKNTCELNIVLTRKVNMLTTNQLIKLTMLLSNWALVASEKLATQKERICFQGEDFSPFRVEHFSRGRQNNFDSDFS